MIPDGYSDVVASLVEEVRPFFAGKPPEMVGGALADLLAIWLASYVVRDNPSETAVLRDSLLAAHIEAVRELVPENEAILREQGQYMKKAPGIGTGGQRLAISRTRSV